ncbi:MAG: MarR family winged helix-turn-helix transcriptional regulator [Actinomycetota bacterium]|nr:MarR family winged helix-turn-helix transcriptional regulator [Actinomycetota bacterium]
MPAPHTGLGTRLRHLLELLDGDVAKTYVERGLDTFRPRFVPVVRALLTEGPLPIRDLATAIGVTHSAASQTVNQMRIDELVTLEPGVDARLRIVALTAKATDLTPILDAEWDATIAAAAALDSELPHPLGDIVEAAITALERRPFRQRIADAGGPPISA